MNTPSQRFCPAALVTLLASALAFLPLASAALADTTTRPTLKASTRPTTKPSTQTSTLSDEDVKRVGTLTRASIGLLKKGDLARAEPLLNEALAIDPEHVTNWYNLACLKAMTDRPGEAIDALEKSAEAGWTDFVFLGRDPDLDSIREEPRYKALVARKDEYQRRAANRALDGLRTRFGDAYLYELDAENKLVFATNVDPTTLAQLKEALQAQAKSLWAQLFEHEPDEFISVIVPSQEDFKKLVRKPGVGGFYMAGPKMLVAPKLGEVMTHEFTHALHAADRESLGQEHAIWVTEGLATLFQAGEYEGDVLVPRDNLRLNALQAAAKGRRLIPLAKLVKMKQPEFTSQANLAYGTSGSVLLYLYEHELLRPFYQAYKSTFDEDPTGRAAMEQVVGEPLEKFESKWIAWMTKRPPVPMSTGPDGAVLGARTGEATDGIKIESLVDGGPAAKAGVKVGDVIVGIGDAVLHDQRSFIPTLVQFKAGDRVNLKIRRGREYIELPITLGKRSELLTDASKSRDGKAATRPAK